jgi:hypothetical protein
MNGEEFIASLLTEFPELTEEVRANKGLLHVQVGAFARRTGEAIARGDLASVDRCFALAHRAFHDPDPPLKNAIYVSYLEHLNFGGAHGPAAQHRMSPLLRQGYAEIMDYLAMLERTSKRSSP